MSDPFCEALCIAAEPDVEGGELLVGTKNKDDIPSGRIFTMMFLYILSAGITGYAAAYITIEAVWVIPLCHFLCMCFVTCNHWFPRILVCTCQSVSFIITYHCSLSLVWNVIAWVGVCIAIVNEIWLYSKKKSNGYRR